MKYSISLSILIYKPRPVNEGGLEQACPLSGSAYRSEPEGSSRLPLPFGLPRCFGPALVPEGNKLVLRVA